MKTHKTCNECLFIPKDSITDKLEAAAKKCATTGNRNDLQAYLKLRKDLL